MLLHYSVFVLRFYVVDHIKKHFKKKTSDADASVIRASSDLNLSVVTTLLIFYFSSYRHPGSFFLPFIKPGVFSSFLVSLSALLDLRLWGLDLCEDDFLFLRLSWGLSEWELLLDRTRPCWCLGLREREPDLDVLPRPFFLPFERRRRRGLRERFLCLILWWRLSFGTLYN